MIQFIKDWLEPFHSVYFYPEIAAGCFLIYFVLYQRYPEKIGWLMWIPLPLSFSGSLAFFTWPTHPQAWNLVIFWSFVQWGLGIAVYSFADKYGWMDKFGVKVQKKIEDKTDGGADAIK